MNEIKEENSILIKYPIKGVCFDSAEEAIAIMKNDPTMTNVKWIHFFEIFLGDRKEEYQGVFEFTEDDFFNKMIEDWGSSYKDFIPKWTREEFWNKINNTPAFTKEEVEKKYTGEQLEMALSFFE